MTHVASQTCRPTEGCRTRHAEYLGQYGETAGQSFLEHFPLGGDEPILRQPRRQCSCQNSFATRLGEKAKNVAFVDCTEGRLHIGIPSQHDPYCIGRQALYFHQKLNAIHFRHPHIRKNYCERSFRLNRSKRRWTSHCRVGLKFAMQQPLVTKKNVWLIINQ